MSRTAEIVLAFGGEDRTFRLNIGRLRALQEKTDAGPQELLSRLLQGTWRVDDLRETLLQGLIGGGSSSADATRLLKSDFDDLPFGQFVQTAQAVLAATLVGAPDEEDETSGEPLGEPSILTLSPDPSFASPESTASEPS